MAFIGYERREEGGRNYRLYNEEKKSDLESAHPARFSPEDKFSKYRIELKREYGLLPAHHDL